MVGFAKRYFYLVDLLKAKFDIAGIIIQKKEEEVPVLPIEDPLYIRHFELRNKTEERYYKNVNIENSIEGLCCLTVGYERLNSEEVEEFIKKIAPDVVISFGVTYLKKNILDVCPLHSFNFHNGLVPWYKGSSAHFWAFYFLEPTFVGCTFHYLNERLDGGDVVHQCTATLSRGDGMHDVSCKATIQMSKDIVHLMEMLEVRGNIDSFPQKGKGRMYYNHDFRPEHLKVIYELFDNRIVDEYLDGKIKCDVPEIVKAF